jgi:predicted NAD-dependent protein-ADP-ribosyltransferase YbiA (DUF1768 family)
MADKFYFYSKSKACAPGKGVNEYVGDPSKYTRLSVDFRRDLSNFHEYKFHYDGYTYNTIEHAFQARKIALVDPEKAFIFTVESGHVLGVSDGSVAQRNRKLAELDKESLKIWNEIKQQVMEDISKAKYVACAKARDVLKATGDAELWHIQQRKKPIRFVHLEEIRKELCDN